MPKRRLLLEALDLVVPRRCALCGVRVGQRHFCRRCLEALPFIGNACALCGVPVAFHQPGGVCCAVCQADAPPYSAARAALEYRFPVDSALKSLKFDRALHYAPAFGALLPMLARARFRNADALVPVPLHRTRQVWRGFNQAIELCKPVARHCRLPILTNVRRVRLTRSQSGLTAAERHKNLAGAFTVRGRLRAKHPLIVDDVVTTGATCTALTQALIEAGADSVGVLAVARAATGYGDANV